MQDQIQQIKQQSLQDLQAIQTKQQLEAIELKYLGRKEGIITTIVKQIKTLTEEQKRQIGPKLQDLKQTFENEIYRLKQQINQNELTDKLQAEFFDITLPGISNPKGTIHPLMQLQTECEEIFSQLGFTIADGPEVESEYFNFEALNIPSWHPARDMQDTFFVNSQQHPEQGNLLLRTHTSPGQIRKMLEYGAPLKIIIPGRVFRYEGTDATHDSIFYQMEGLLIDEHINLGDLKGLMNEFLSRILNQDQKSEVRFRPGYFPFTEPGIELDFLWQQPNGKSRWMEMMGAGMVHPNVLKAGGIDPNRYQGWAFGFGLTRLAMIKYQIPDIRLLHGNDLRFLKQF